MHIDGYVVETVSKEYFIRLSFRSTANGGIIFGRSIGTHPLDFTASYPEDNSVKL
jgi:hypothetical protein